MKNEKNKRNGIRKKCEYYRKKAIDYDSKLRKLFDDNQFNDTFENIIKISLEESPTLIKVFGAIAKYFISALMIEDKTVRDFFTKCYTRTVSEYIGKSFFGEVDIEICNKCIDYIINEINYSDFTDSDFDYWNFCQNPEGQLDDFIFNKIIEFLKTLYNDFYPSKLTWYQCLYESIDFFLQDKRFKEKFSDSEPTKIVNKIRLLQLKNEYLSDLYKFLNINAFGDEKLTINNIYVPVDIIVDDDIRKYKDTFIFNYLSNKKNGLVILKGEPGSGKSTILKKTAMKMIEDEQLVFHINLSKLKIVDKNNMMKNIITELNSSSKFFYKITNGNNDISLKMIEDIKNSLFIFDGLDELYSEDNVENVVDFINACSILGMDFRVIVSGRSYIFLNLKIILNKVRAFNIMIDDLSKSSAEEIINRYNSILKSDVTFNDFNDLDPEFIKIPLLIFLYIYVCKFNKHIPGKHFNKASIYELILKTMYHRSQSSLLNSNSFYNFDSKSFEIDDTNANSYANYKRSLQIIGYIAYINDNREVKLKDCYQYAESLGFKQFKYWMGDRENGGPFRLILHFFAGENNDTVYFYHKTFYEYLGENEILDLILNNRKIFSKEELDYCLILLLIQKERKYTKSYMDKDFTVSELKHEFKFYFINYIIVNYKNDKCFLNNYKELVNKFYSTDIYSSLLIYSSFNLNEITEKNLINKNISNNYVFLNFLLDINFNYKHAENALQKMNSLISCISSLLRHEIEINILNPFIHHLDIICLYYYRVTKVILNLCCVGLYIRYSKLNKVKIYSNFPNDINKIKDSVLGEIIINQSEIYDSILNFLGIYCFINLSQFKLSEMIFNVFKSFEITNQTKIIKSYIEINSDKICFENCDFVDCNIILKFNVLCINKCNFENCTFYDDFIFNFKISNYCKFTMQEFNDYIERKKTQNLC